MNFKLSLLVAVFGGSTLLLYAQQQAPVKQNRAKRTAATAPNASVEEGKKVYMQYCLSCHQSDGGGVQHLNPPLIKTSYVLGDKTKLISIIQNGFNEEVEINDDTYSNNMPSLSYLKDKEIADVLTYVRNSFGNKASAVTLKEVTAIRPKVKK